MHVPIQLQTVRFSCNYTSGKHTEPTRRQQHQLNAICTAEDPHTKLISVCVWWLNFARCWLHVWFFWKQWRTFLFRWTRMPIDSTTLPDTNTREHTKHVRMKKWNGGATPRIHTNSSWNEMNLSRIAPHVCIYAYHIIIVVSIFVYRVHLHL